MNALHCTLTPSEPGSVAEMHPNRSISSGTRIPALDGLRGVAILLVLFCHGTSGLKSSSKLLAYLLVPGRIAWSGVDLFFVLSGFLIGGILLDARDSPRYYSTFYLRRAYRILPLYALVLIVFSIRFLVPFGTGAEPVLHAYKNVPWISYATFTQNISMAVLASFGVNAMSITWSLAVEEQFYLTIPILIRKLTDSYLRIVLGLVIVAAPMLRIAFCLWAPHGSFVSYVLTPCRADALSLGVLTALLVRNRTSSQWIRENRNVLRLTTVVLFLGVVYLTHRGGYEFSWFMATLGYSWLALFYTGCLLLAVTATEGLTKRLLESRILMQLGAIAYCTYLIHVTLIEACSRALGVQLLGDLAGISLTLLVAKLSLKFFEGPLIRQGHAYRY
jgi:peptidoglycan/LPS O-acetylase OafA/YrhL